MTTTRTTARERVELSGTRCVRIDAARIVRPTSVAIIGASEDFSKFGGRFVHNVIKHGFAGRLIFINPARDSILGRPAYRSIEQAPGPIDVALVAVPASLLRETIDACARAGVGACIVVTAQLGEFDAKGRALQDELVAIAQASGMRLVGPNCMGLIAPSHRLGLTSSPTLQYADHLCPGAVALISQSGALMGTLFVLGYDHGVGFSFLVSVGNQADLELCDFLEAAVEDAETKVICLYVEQVSDPSRFAALARRAAVAGKPVLVVKAGRTEAGRTMARSHTASLAGSYEAFDAVCRACGATLMDEPEGMLMTAGLLARNPVARTDGLGVVVSSGGGGAVLADRLTQAGATLVAWDEATSTRLGKHFLPQHRNNPIDLGAHVGALGPHVFHDTIRAVYEDPQVGVFVYLFTPQPLMPETLDALLEIWRDGRKPVFVVLDTSRFAEDLRRRMLDAGMPFVTDIDDVLRGVEVVRQRLAMTTPEPAPDRPPRLPPVTPVARDGFLTEPETKALLSAYGIATTQDRIVATRQEAIAAAREIGLPVVLKAVSRRIVHKSDGGFVHLGLENERAVADAFDAIASAWPDGDEAVAVSVQPMVQGGTELIVGARHDPQFGPLALVGLGGVFVEVLRDVQMWPAPVSPPSAAAMLRRLKSWPLLAGARGRPALDIEAVADTVARLSWLAHDLGPRLIDIEINPLIVRAAGLGAIAVDGRANLGTSA